MSETKDQKVKSNGCSARVFEYLIVIVFIMASYKSHLRITFSVLAIYFIYKFVKRKLKQKSINAMPILNNDLQIHNDAIYGEYDNLLFDAGEYVIKYGRASTGMLQREFKIGFNRAELIINQLCQIGVISKGTSVESRNILINLNQFQNIKNNFKGNLVSYQSDFDKFSQDNSISDRIKMYNDKFDYMDGHDFEYFCAELLKKAGYNYVQVTQGSRDNGIDILATKDGVKYGIQCKCYSSDIGIKAVQEVFSGAKFYDCHVPVVLTNRYFTSQAQGMAKKTNVLLWDRDYLESLVKNNLDNKEPELEHEQKLLEKSYSIDDDLLLFSLYNNKKLEILGICKTYISSASIYFTTYTTLKDNWIDKFDFEIAIQYEDKIAIAKIVDDEEFLGGKIDNGDIIIGIPQWMIEARDEFFNQDEIKIFEMVENIMNCINEFVSTAEGLI